MTKLLRVVKNELIKLSKRRSIRIMLAITVIIAIGTSLLFELSLANDTDAGEEYLVEQWKEEISELERFFVKDHYHNESFADVSLRAAQYRKRSEMLSYLIDNQYSPYDWRYTSGIIEQVFELKLYMEQNFNYDQNKAEHDRLLGLIEKDDWRSYYKKKAELTYIQALRVYPMAEQQVKEAAWFEYNYRIQHDLEPGDELWRDELIASAASSRLSLAYLDQQQYEHDHPEYIPPSTGDSSMEKADLTYDGIAENRAAVNDKLAIATYRLEHGIRADVDYVFGHQSVVSSGEGSVFWENFATSPDYIIGVGVLIIIVSGLIVASEFSSGTIKFLLVSPIKRWKIIMAKYVTVVLLSIVLTLLMYLSSAVSALVISGGFGLFDVIVRAENGVAWGVSPFLLVLRDYCWAYIEVLVVATMAFALSALMRNTAVSVGVGLLAYLSGTALSELLAHMGVDLGRYILFSNLDLPSIAAGASIFPNQTVLGAAMIIVAHMAVFVLTAWDGFVRREI